METLRLAFVLDRCEPYYHGGYERHVWELARRLAKRHEVTVFTSLPVMAEELDGVQFIRAAPHLPYVRKYGGHSPGQSMLFSLALFQRLPKRTKHDFIDVLGIPYVHVPVTRFRQLLGRWHWGVTIWEAWYNYSYLQGWGERPARAAFRALLRLSLAGTHVIVTGSDCTRRALVRNYHVPSSRIEVVSPGIDTGIVASIAPAKHETDVIYVGRLDKYKRVGDLVDAVALLKKQGQEIKVSIVGDGPDRTALASRAIQLGVERQIAFFGWVTEQEKYALLKASKVFVLPSEREGFSIATLEAMCCGVCPLVAQPALDELFGVSELVLPEESGLVYPVGMRDHMATSLSTLLGDEGRRRRLAQRARELSESYNLDTVVWRYESKVLSRALL